VIVLHFWNGACWNGQWNDGWKHALYGFLVLGPDVIVRGQRCRYHMVSECRKCSKSPDAWTSVSHYCSRLCEESWMVRLGFGPGNRLMALSGDRPVCLSQQLKEQEAQVGQSCDYILSRQITAFKCHGLIRLGYLESKPLPCAISALIKPRFWPSAAAI
jgi:hypothetical protein